MDDIPLEVKIAQTEADDATLDEEIAKAASINSDLGNRLEYFRKIRETQSRKAACLLGLAEQNKVMERELARMEGREYRDPDNPDGDWPEAPEPPEP